MRTSSMPKTFACRGGLLGALIIALGGHAQAADESQSANVEALKRQLDDQTNRIEALKRDLAAQEAKVAEMRRQMGLEKVRGGQAPARSQAASQPERVAQAQPQTQPQQPVGQAPDTTEARPQIAPIFEQPGVLTPKGKFVVEPSLQYSYSSNNRIALVGYTIIPAIVVGLIDVREVKRNTWTTTLTGRYGLTNRLEVEARVPYVYRSDDSVGREVGGGAAQDQAFNATGKGIGDIEVTGRYQLNQGGPDTPYYIGGLRFKSRTGKDAFETPVSATVEGARVGQGLQTELPTGSGFYTLQPSLTALFPSDPAVFFGSVSYQYNFKRTGVVQKRSDGPDQEIGEVQAGGVFGFNLGMGLAINDRASFSLGYDHQSVAKPKINGSAPANAVRVQLGQLLVGYSYRLSDKQSVNFSLGAGLTRDTPDLTLSLRVPFTL